MSQRDYDVVLYGASGFTGKQTVSYFAQHAPHALRWAMAGRNNAKLEAIKRELGTQADILVADSQDQAALNNLAARTRVMLTTAGPYALYGSGLVAACVRHQTHYVDITGETVWVRELIDRHHAQAAIHGTRIIPFCGFDSIPSDLGAYLMARYIQNKIGAQCREIKAFFQMAGGVNGGTLATAFNLYESGKAKLARDPFLLNPQPVTEQVTLLQNQDPTTVLYDSDVNAWAAPFVMGPINTRVVRRSQALLSELEQGYGTDFRYQEFLKFNGALGWMGASGMAAGGMAFELALASPLRSLLKSILPAPGAGPSEKTMNEGWFSCELIGLTDNGQKVRGVIKDKGDPGNRATVKFLCESALCLALQENELPGGTMRGGILTPATALGDVLTERLRQAGMTIEIGDR